MRPGEHMMTQVTQTTQGGVVQEETIDLWLPGLGALEEKQHAGVFHQVENARHPPHNSLLKTLQQ